MSVYDGSIYLYDVGLNGKISDFEFYVMEVYLKMQGCRVAWDFDEDFGSGCLITTRELMKGDIDSFRSLVNVKSVDAIVEYNNT